MTRTPDWLPPGAAPDIDVARCPRCGMPIMDHAHTVGRVDWCDGARPEEVIFEYDPHQ